ncbi:MAG: cupredoxin domain-containing protein [Nanoarchaeota archaeon]|nr:cupredoxin domain-containing protein [Nanoarchaeota archaeon]
MKYAIIALLLIVLVSGCIQTTFNTNVETNINTNSTQITDNTTTEPIVEEPEELIANVELSDYNYIPTELTVKVGTTVIWTNVDTTFHTVSSANLKRTSGILQPGESWNYTFDTLGKLNYYCAIHFEKGAIIVTE